MSVGPQTSRLGLFSSYLIHFLSIVFASCFYAPWAEAYTNQWEWKVAYVSVGSDRPTGSSVPRPTATFNTKQEAVAAMRAIGPGPATLEEETGIAAMSSTWVEYRYITLPKNPTVTPWTYWAFRVIQGNIRVDLPGPFSSEAEALAAVYAEGEWDRCDADPMELAHDWRGPAGQNPDTTTSENKRYVVSGHTIPCSSWITFQVTIGRSRSVTCPSANYALISDGPPPYCRSFYWGYIQGHVVDCPAGGPSTRVGNPCDVATAGKTETALDYSVNGLEFSRHYNSATLESGRGLGVGWTHNFAARLIITEGVVQGLVRPTGHHDPLSSVAGGRYITSSGTGIHVRQVGAEWVAFLNDGSKEVYDSNGRLLRLVSHAGATTILEYNTASQLTNVTGPHGHSLELAYIDGRIASLSDPAGALTAYDYDTQGNLTGVEYPDGTSRTYHYEHPTFRNHLTGITDESGTRYATFGYDSLGRATSSEHGGGVGRVDIDYGATTSVATDSAGASTTYTFTSDALLPRRVTGISREGIDEAYGVPSPFTDFQRRVTQEVDARGMITKFRLRSRSPDFENGGVWNATGAHNHVLVPVR
jgi:YD repeat-containing protein